MKNDITYSDFLNSLKEMGFSFRLLNSNTNFFLLKKGTFPFKEVSITSNFSNNISHLEIKSEDKGKNVSLIASNFNLILDEVKKHVEEDVPTLNQDDIDALNVISAIRTISLKTEDRLLITYPNDITAEHAQSLNNTITRWLGPELASKTLLIVNDIEFKKVTNDGN